MATSLERALVGLERDFGDQYKQRIPARFRSRLHEFGHHAVSDDRFDPAALLQHCGGPTRLLDFTQSLFVAAFFAFERATAEAASVIGSVRVEAMTELRHMHIGAARLFPGIDGFARSLKQWLTFDHL